MRARLFMVLACLCVSLAGCASDDWDRESFTIRNPFRTEPAFDPSTAPKASAIVATRVHTVGSALISANAQELHKKPIFFTVGLKEPMIFHRSAGDVIISEGLVEQCGTDSELAAVICYELGKMAAKEDRLGERGDGNLPPAPPPPSDVVGGSQPADMTRLAEQGYYDRRGPRPTRGSREPRRDPRMLAQEFLTRAGHDADDLTRMESLLQEAEDNAEKRDILRSR